MDTNPDISVAPESESSPTIAGLGSRNVHEFIRYFIASAAALAADAGALYILTSIVGVPYLYSGAIAFALGLVVVYVLSVVWVFEHRTSRSLATEIFIFMVIGIIGLGVNELVLYVLTGMFGIFYLFSKIASVVVVFTWNFFARKYMLF